MQSHSNKGVIAAQKIHSKYVIPLLNAFFADDKLYRYHFVTIDSVDPIDKSATFHFADGTVTTAKHGVIVPVPGDVFFLEECKTGWMRLVDSFRGSIIG